MEEALKRKSSSPPWCCQPSKWLLWGTLAALTLGRRGGRGWYCGTRLLISLSIMVDFGWRKWCCHWWWAKGCTSGGVSNPQQTNKHQSYHHSNSQHAWYDVIQLTRLSDITTVLAVWLAKETTNSNLNMFNITILIFGPPCNLHSPHWITSPPPQEFPLASTQAKGHPHSH